MFSRLINRSSLASAKGFTLLEVMIALGIFSIIGLASYRVLHTVVVSQATTENVQDELAELQRAMLIVEQDLLQLANRPIRGAYGDPLPAAATDQEDYLFEFTRADWRNPLGHKRSELQRVAYKLGKPKAQQESDSDSASVFWPSNLSSPTSLALLRYYWPVLDRAQDSEPVEQILLMSVGEFELRFMGPDGDWHSEWPLEDELPVALSEELAPSANKQVKDIPIGIELRLVTERYGELVRRFALRRVMSERPESTPNNERRDSQNPQQPSERPEQNPGQSRGGQYG